MALPVERDGSLQKLRRAGQTQRTERPVGTDRAGHVSGERPVHPGEPRGRTQVEIRRFQAHPAHRLVVQQVLEIHIRPALPEIERKEGVALQACAPVVVLHTHIAEIHGARSQR